MHRAWKWTFMGSLAANGALFLFNCSVEIKGEASLIDGGADGRQLPEGPDEPGRPLPKSTEDVADAGPNARAIEAFAVDDANQLIRFSTRSPGTVRTTPITSLPGDETVQGIDIRPMTGVLYAFTTGSPFGGRVYSVVKDTGKATWVNGDGGYPVIINTTAMSYGVDFDPISDRLRINSNDGLGLRLHPESGRSVNPTSDQPPLYADGGPANIVGTAFTNSLDVRPKKTSLYAIDSKRDVLVAFQGSIPEGAVKDVGPLAVDAAEVAGFDIYGGTDGVDGGVKDVPLAGYAALTVSGTTGLYRIDLESGAATFIGEIGHNRPIRGLTLEIDRPQD